jgi:hypothetical protein
METWPSLSNLDGLYAQAVGWLNANLLAGETVPQVLAIAGSFLVARVLVHSLGVRAGGLADKIAAQRQQMVLRLRPLGLPIAWALLLWFSSVALEFPYPQRDLHLKTAVPVTVVRTTDRSIG